MDPMIARRSGPCGDIEIILWQKVGMGEHLLRFIMQLVLRLWNGLGQPNGSKPFGGIN